jgi:hypothetical protein
MCVVVMITIRSTVEAAGEGFAVLAHGSRTDVANQTPHWHPLDQFFRRQLDLQSYFGTIYATI